MVSMNNVQCGLPLEDFPVPPGNKGIKQTYKMDPKGVVVHNTWNSAKAKAEASYMVGNSNWTSFHSVVDEEKVVECIPFNYNSWHCGATYGNRNLIGVEIARSRSDINTFLKAEDNSARYVAGICKKYGWGLSQVQTHQQQSGKYCPHKTLDLGWQRYLTKVSHYLGVNLGDNKSTVDNLDVAEYAVTEGGYSVKTNTPGDVLNVRNQPRGDAKIVSTYSHGSVIYVDKIYKNPKQGTWYKIPNVGYVSAKYCVGIPSTPKPEVKPVPESEHKLYQLIIYGNEVDRAYALKMQSALHIPSMHYEDFKNVEDKYSKVIYVGGTNTLPKNAYQIAGANRKETEALVDKFIEENK